MLKCRSNMEILEFSLSFDYLELNFLYLEKNKWWIYLTIPPPPPIVPTKESPLSRKGGEIEIVKLILGDLLNNLPPPPPYCTYKRIPPFLKEGGGIVK